jgi:tetratricopeptide (TPR) repeat protein
MLTDEPRSVRVDWERCSLYVNIGNTYSGEGNYDNAAKQYKKVVAIGQEHIDNSNIEGNDSTKLDGMAMTVVAKRANSFALKKANRLDEAKALLSEVLKLQLQVNELHAQQQEQEAAGAGSEEEAEAAPEAVASQ